MKYDFDRVISRRQTDCVKWDAAEILFGSKEVIPMWNADMDFPIAKPITEALRKRTEHEIYGYTLTPWSTISAVIDRLKRKYDWTVKPEWIVFTPGVIPALFAAVKAYTKPGDSVIHQSPIYYPFWEVIKDNGCHVANNQLKRNNGRYEIDFEDLEDQFTPRGAIVPAPSRARMMMLCNPHNPVGRVWTTDELKRIGDIIFKHDAVMVSDEIHCELLFKGYKHTPFASISEDFEQRSVVCMAASKTFNLAGLGASVIIIPNAKLRAQFIQAKTRGMSDVNIFGYVATEAAFKDGDEWLEQLLAYLNDSLAYMTAYMAEKIPKIKMIKPEGTYLIWLDCKDLGLDNHALRRLIRENARLGLEDGYIFGPGGDGFIRMNIACPRATLTEALNRLEKAVKSLN